MECRSREALAWGQTYRGVVMIALWVSWGFGCAQDSLNAPGSPSFDVTSPRTLEGEFIGNLFVNGVKSTSGTYATLEPYDQATQARLRDRFSHTIWGPATYSRMWEWYDPKAGGNCGNLAPYLAGDTTERGFEAHWSGPSDSAPLRADSVREAHCIRPGTYEFSAAGKTFLVDYVPLAHTPGAPDLIRVWDSTAGLYQYLEALNWDDTLNGWLDLVANVDIGTGSFADTAVLDIENAVRDAGTRRVFVMTRRVAPPDDRPAFAFAGIGRPDAFFTSLERAGWALAGRMAFADHRRYSAADLARIVSTAQQAGARVLVTTEKDAARLDALRSPALPLRAAPLDVHVEPADEFGAMLRSAAP